MLKELRLKSHNYWSTQYWAFSNGMFFKPEGWKLDSSAYLFKKKKMMDIKSARKVD